MLTQNPSYTAVAVDSTGSQANYCDLVWTTNLYPISNSSTNWRFYLNVLNNFTSYQNTYSIVHTYASLGTYNISMTFTSSNKVFQKSVFITDCN